MNNRQSFFSNIPPVVLNLLIINTICLFADWFLSNKFEIGLNGIFGLHFFMSDEFRFFQPITYMFMHGGFTHLFFNMFAVYMFGQVFEMVWGGWKFLLYYFVAGIGAAFVQEVVWYIDYGSIINHIDYQLLEHIKENGRQALEDGKNYTDLYAGRLNLLLNIPTVGASGAVFGILLAFGWMFPQEKLMLIFLPVPIPARIFVILYAVAELFFGVANFSGDNVAHFAHLGGLIFGLLLILWWKKQKKLYTRQI
ncbi:MAG: rhomboid family intramembrane serine protease [Prevotellaceae bacterium]|jgi:membrane associated rhomboid family serine protease|nr:rhomboid family intramembrane serine protease [Prevotellaceae bacterium]